MILSAAGPRAAFAPLFRQLREKKTFNPNNSANRVFDEQERSCRGSGSAKFVRMSRKDAPQHHYSELHRAFIQSTGLWSLKKKRDVT